MRALTILLTVTNALWLGGLATLFLITGYMRAYDPPAATRSAPHIFASFEMYHLALAGASLLLIAALWSLSARSRARLVTTVLLAVAIAAAVVSASLITPRLAQLRRDGQTESPAFVRGHHASLACYGVETLAVLGATIALPIWNPRRRERSATASESAPAHSVAPAGA